VALGAQVVDLGRLGFLDQADQVGGVGQVAVVKAELGVILVRVDIEVVDAFGVEGRRPALHAVHPVALRQKHLRQVAAVLAGDPRYKRNIFHKTWRPPANPPQSGGKISYKCGGASRGKTCSHEEVRVGQEFEMATRKLW